MKTATKRRVILTAAAVAVLAAVWLLTVNFGMLGFMFGVGLVIGWTEFI